MKFIGLLFAFAFCVTTIVRADERRPNVLFIVCDDLNTHVEPAGYQPIQTPTLSALANECVTFRRAYCQYPVCGPSRASFLHGLYPESTGVLDNTADIRTTRPGTVSMPEFFRKQGYWTASVGKVFHSPRHEHGPVAWNEHLRFENEELPIVVDARQKFERERGSINLRKNRNDWRRISKEIAAPLNAQTPPGHGRSGLTDEQHKDGKNVRQVTRWLKNRSFQDAPFFIALGIQKPHVPFLAPDKYFDLYPTDSIRYQADSTQLWEGIPRDAISGRYKAFGFQLGVENDSLRREYMQAYHACISFVDAQLSLVMQCLREEDLWDETIIVFTSDHGYHLGDHFMWGKVTLFDIGTRVPFMIRFPGMETAGTHSENLVELVDVFPTLVELAGLKAPSHLQGSSLVKSIRDPSHVDVGKTAYTVVRRGNGLGHALRDQGWRYAAWPTGEELYDLLADPHEKMNLALDPTQKDRIAQFRDRLSATRRRASLQRSTQDDL